MLAYHLSTFKVEATPPLGHPLCGGWIKPADAIDDPLWLRGIVLQGAGLPIVLAALDWTGVLNESHRLWTEALADAAHTTADRVALHCVHQHNAPFVDREGNALLVKHGLSPTLHDEPFVAGLIARSRQAVRESLTSAQPVTHVRTGSASVVQVASNRRVLGPDGKVKFVRYSATKDPEARAAPEGTIDPLLRSVRFFRDGTPLARLYYYTVHPMSYYGDGRVTPDFVGLALARHEKESPELGFPVYFTGAAGNITAGKYNDGASANRDVLAGRILDAMRLADRGACGSIRPLDTIAWTTSEFRFRPREDLDRDRLLARVLDPKTPLAERNRSAMAHAWLARLEAGRPIVLSRLDLGEARILHLPAETFVEYQLDAQAARPNLFLATAAYGDGGPWYIPLRRSFDEGGYEPSAALVARDTEASYREAIAALLRRAT